MFEEDEKICRTQSKITPVKASLFGNWLPISAVCWRISGLSISVTPGSAMVGLYQTWVESQEMAMMASQAEARVPSEPSHWIPSTMASRAAYLARLSAMVWTI